MRNKVIFQLLEIDLSTYKKKVVDVTEDIRRYMCARGYGAKLLWDRVPQGADPLGEEKINLLKKVRMNFVIPTLEKIL